MLLDRPPRGLFVGVSTLDSIFALQGVPAPNTKSIVRDWALLAGGPATNASVAFRALGGETTLLTVLGSHPLAEVIREDLTAQQIDVRDLAPDYSGPPSFASVLVSSPGGDRLAAATGAIHLPKPEGCGDLLERLKPDVVLVDGHLMPLALDVARKAQAQHVPVVMDAGSWRPGFDQLLPHCDVVICSEDFAPTGVQGADAVLDYLADLNIPYRAVTQGERPVSYRCPSGSGSVPVESVEAVDTLGAGDIYHGAFAHAWAAGERDFPAALDAASRTASLSCRYFGTRSWIGHLQRSAV